MSTFAERLSKAIEHRGWKKDALEREAKLGTGTITKLTKGERTMPRPATVQRIADALEVSYEWLAVGQGVMVEKEERYNAMPAIRAMAKADGYPAAFVEKFEQLLDLDEQPTADDLWAMFKETYAKSRGKSPNRSKPGDDLSHRPGRKRPR